MNSRRWACFHWAGPLLPEWQRRGPNGAAPPPAVQDWTMHGETRARVVTDPAAAVAWLRGQVDQWADRLRPRDPDRHARLVGYLDAAQADPALRHLCAFGPCDVLCRISRHNRIVTFQHSTGGGEAVAWAIVPDNAEDLQARRGRIVDVLAGRR